MRKGRLSTLSQLGAMEGEPGKRYEGRPIHSAGSAATTELYARYKAEQGIKVHARATAWGPQRIARIRLWRPPSARADSSAQR
jgi:hypothetical protein